VNFLDLDKKAEAAAVEQLTAALAAPPRGSGEGSEGGDDALLRLGAEYSAAAGG
jgi:hypothetical protein